MPGTVKSELLPDADRSHKCDCQEKVSWKRNLPLDKSHFITETGILKFICGRYGKRQNDAVIFAGKRVLENERQNDQRGQNYLYKHCLIGRKDRQMIHLIYQTVREKVNILGEQSTFLFFLSRDRKDFREQFR